MRCRTVIDGRLGWACASAVAATMLLAAGGIPDQQQAPAETAHLAAAPYFAASAHLAAARPTPPPLALLSTTGAGVSTWWLAVGDGTRRDLGSFAHLPGGNVRATVLRPDGPVLLATARMGDTRDASFDGALFRLDPDGSAKELCAAVATASRPLVTETGRVFVARGATVPIGNTNTPGLAIPIGNTGTRGAANPIGNTGIRGAAIPIGNMAARPLTNDTAVRIDDLTIDEVDPIRGAVTTRLRERGYLLHLAGALGAEVFVYRILESHADLVALDLQDGSVRVLADLAGFARDFSVDSLQQRVVFREKDEHDPRIWVVDAVSIQSGMRTRLYQGPSFALAPHAWPDGGVAINPNQRGLSLLGSPDPVLAPLGDGVDLLRAISQDARFIAALHTRESALPIPFLLERASGTAYRLPVDAGAHIEIAGFVTAIAASRGAR